MKKQSATSQLLAAGAFRGIDALSATITPPNLVRRRKDFDVGSQGASHDSQKARWSAGGYHRPGSNKK